MNFRYQLSLMAATVLLCPNFSLQVAGNRLGISDALAQTSTMPDRKVHGDRLFQKGEEQFRDSRFQEALETYKQVLVIRQELSDKAGIAQTLNNLGEVYNKLAQYPKAQEVLQQALAIRQELDDKAGVGETLNNIGDVYGSLSQYPKALEILQQALKIRQAVGDRKGEGQTLNNLGGTYIRLSQYPKALEISQQALKIRQAVGDRKGEGETLNNIGLIYSELSQYYKALELYQQALAIKREIANKAGEGVTLNNIGSVYQSLGQYSKALEFQQQALAIFREVDDKANEGTALNQIGVIYSNLGQYPKALEFYQRALAIERDIGDKATQETTLNNIGVVYANQGQYFKALASYQQALIMAREVGDKVGVAASLVNIGFVYQSLSEYPKALASYQQALAIERKIGNKQGVGTILNNIGLVYSDLSEYPKALASYQQALAIAKDIGDKAMQGKTLNNIGVVYQSLGEYSKALASYQQALAIERDIGDKAGVAGSLSNTGFVYQSLGEYPKALTSYQQALATEREIGNKQGVGTILNNIGVVYQSLGEYFKALTSYQQALAIAKDIGDKAQEATNVNNIGQVYSDLGEYPKAQEFCQQALAIVKEIGDRTVEGKTLNNIGVIYQRQGEYPKAQEFYQQALVIHKQIGNKAGEGLTLSNIGYLLDKQKQPELAIVFYKQSVNVTEAIRRSIRVLPKEQQQSYTKTIAGTYRFLADLLLKKDRVIEAQQVLDLLKVQELQDYLRNVRGNSQTAQGVDLLPREQRVTAEYAAIQDQAIALGKELAELRKIPTAKRTAAQQQRIAELEKAEQTIRQEFNSFIKSPTIVALTQQLKTTAAGQNLALENLNKLRASLRQLQQNAVLLYPMVLDDRLEVVLVTATSPPIHRSVAVKRVDLNKAILQFRAALQDPSSDAKVPAKQLYEWLIKPIEKDLTQAQAQTLIYAPDGQLRYIPLAALFDGKQRLVQRFRINNITAASLTDLTTKPQTSPHVLAAAFTQGTYTLQVGDRQLVLGGLQFAGKEVNDLASLIPGTTKLLNRAFSRDGTVPLLNDYNIIHFATHAAFVPGQPEDSFILFGNGDRVTLLDVGKWSLPDVDLVVLSACETALGMELGNGEEILGLGYQIQLTGARAVIASLWSVDDGGTQALMDGFYAALQQGKTSKAEALAKAQIALITGDYKALDEKRGLASPQRSQTNLPAKVISSLSHPYYWAPFVLIGNGL